MLTLARCVATAASYACPFTASAEERGLSQRGGSVTATVRFGTKKVAPLIGCQSADLLVGLDVMEATRHVAVVRSGGVVLCDNSINTPASEQRAQPPSYVQEPKETAIHELRNHGRLLLIDCAKFLEARSNGCARNMLLLGAASLILPLPCDAILRAISETFGEPLQKLNLNAFQIGRASLAHFHKHQLCTEGNDGDN